MVRLFSEASSSGPLVRMYPWFQTRWMVPNGCSAEGLRGVIVPVAFALDLAAGADTVEVTVKIEPQQVGGVMRRASGLFGDGMFEAGRGQLKGIDEGAEEAPVLCSAM